MTLIMAGPAKQVRSDALEERRGAAPALGTPGALK